VADIPLFLKWWDERGSASSITMQQGADAITVSTIHKSKGLQYKVVIVPYLSWSMAPETRGRPLVVWAEADGEGLGDVGAVPINYKEAMARSWFSARYYREQVLSYIDSANLFYVAVTRAECELHLMTSSNPYDGRSSVGNLLCASLGTGGDFTEWGTPLHPERGVATENNAMRTYPTSRPDSKMRLRLPYARYIEDGAANPDLSPRQYGVLMHRAFENAATVHDVHLALDTMLADALLSPSEHAHLQEIIDRALANPLVAGWFGGQWETVRNEGDILTPGEYGVKRPDRVMVRGEKAVVVDYKFGRSQSADHAAQLRGYMRLLTDMGHTDVDGYLWYVSQGKIEKV
jgi:ATP-dependent exoDNAse (exonuclease V) beta subunit